MSVLRRMFSSRATRVHLVLFMACAFGFITLDLAQGVDSEFTFARLDWAHIILLIWAPLFIVHVLMSSWGDSMDDLDRETLRGLRGWFSGPGGG